MLALLLLMTATPVGSPGDWITTEDYPEEALKSGVEGTVDFSLSVTKGGAVSDCKILQSSGSEILDTETCSLLIERAQFEPAEATSNYQSRVSWKIPPQPKMTLETQGVYALTSLTPEGEPADCVNGDIGTPIESPDFCEGFADVGAINDLLGENKLSIAQMELRMFMKPASLPDPAPASKGSDQLQFELVSANFTVDHEGIARDCEVHSTKFSPPDFAQICDSFDLEKPDFVSGDAIREPIPMQLKVELVVTPRSDIHKTGVIQKN